MGNLLSSNPAIQQVSRSFLKNQPVNPRGSIQQLSKQPEVKSVKKERTIETLVQQSIDKKVEQIFSFNELLSILQCLSLQSLAFDEVWSRLQKITGKFIVYKMIFPEALNSQGKLLLSNGFFVVSWLKIVSKSPYLNMSIIYKQTRQKLLPNVITQKQCLLSYLHKCEKQNQIKTQIYNNLECSLKRIPFRGVDKKVQFGTSEYFYVREEPETRETKKQKIRKQHGFILDYFQINDIFLLEEVDIIGVIKEYENVYSIIQAKIKETGKEVTCLGLHLSKNHLTHSVSTLQIIDKQFESLCFLDMNGNNSDSVWVNSLEIKETKK